MADMDVLRLVQECFCLKESPVSHDPRSRLQTPREFFKFLKRHQDCSNMKRVQASGF